MNEETNLPSGPAPVPQTHPLRTLFQQMVGQAFQDTIGLTQQAVSVYLADLLTDFAHVDVIHRLHNGQGRPLQEVAAMLMETDLHQESHSFDQERTVHKHIGDFTLFWAGIYPDTLRKMRAQGKADYLIDYVRQGKQSYYIVSTFAYGRYAEDAPLFRQLSEQYELCLYGLGLVRRDWERLSLGNTPAS